MSNVWKAVKLDFFLVRPYAKTIGFIMILPVVFAAVNRSLVTGVSFAMCLTAMTTGYTFSITEKNSMERLYGLLPVRKRELVIGRYLFVIIMGVTEWIFSLIIHPVIITGLRGTVSSFEWISAAAAGIFFFALSTVFQLPGYYKLGSIKGRAFVYIPVVFILLTSFLAKKTSFGESKWLLTIMHSPALWMLLLFTVVAVMYMVSLSVSVKIIKNKEGFAA